MLLAETHGKGRSEVEDDEDLLTSTVFGHLRYVPPPVFWGRFLAMAKGTGGRPLAEALRLSEGGFAAYRQLIVDFWPRSLNNWEPDLILRFMGDGLPVVILVVEVKLWSGKSGEGEDDQLGRYLLLLDQIEKDCGSGILARTALIYLTPRDACAEIERTLQAVQDRSRYEGRLFRLQWQDVLAAAKAVMDGASEPAKTILQDVAAFLHGRRLEYFEGYHCLDQMRNFPNTAAVSFYTPLEPSGFAGMRMLAGLEEFAVIPAGWMS